MLLIQEVRSLRVCLLKLAGDHVYKRNADLPLKEQMITALPDVKSLTLTDDDEFIILACDGIW